MNLVTYSKEKMLKLWFNISKILSNTTWESLRKKIVGRKYDLSKENLEEIKQLLAKNYYVILINRKAHFTTYGIGFISFIKTGKWPSYSHALMNVDSETNPNKSEEFMFMEATIEGVHWSPFNKIFNCDNTCLLKPKNVSLEEWDLVMTALLNQNGKKYDTLFDLADENTLSCVELVRIALKSLPNYENRFANFEKMISEVGNLTPQMFRDCLDFEVVYEI